MANYKPTITKADQAQAAKRLRQMQRDVDACATDPVKLLSELSAVLAGQVAAEERAGREGDARYYAQLEVYTDQLREGMVKLLKGGAIALPVGMRG